MKKIVFALTLLAVVMLGSCQRSNVDRLSARKAQLLYDKEVKVTAENLHSFELTTGYYECNNEEQRYMLRQLAANDIITYACERLAKPTPQGKEIAHFVTVTLTPKGERLIVKEVVPQDEKDLQYRVVKATYPEDAVTDVEFPDEYRTKLVVEVDNRTEALDSVFVLLPKDGLDTVAALDTMAVYLYDQACKRTHMETVNLLGYKTKSLKARNISVFPIDRRNSAAYAEILCEISDVTPVGRICMNAEENQRFFTSEVYGFSKRDGWQYIHATDGKIWPLVLADKLNFSLAKSRFYTKSVMMFGAAMVNIEMKILQASDKKGNDTQNALTKMNSLLERYENMGKKFMQQAEKLADTMLPEEQVDTIVEEVVAEVSQLINEVVSE